MEWYLWLVAVTGGIFSWFLAGALAERMTRRVWDPSGQNGEGAEILFVCGGVGFFAYIIACLVVGVGRLPLFSKIFSMQKVYALFRWVRGVEVGK